MNKYIVITEFADKEDITTEVISCENKKNLLFCWARKVSYPRIGPKSRLKLLQDVKFHCYELNNALVLVNGTQNLYTDLYLINGVFIIVYAVAVRKSMTPYFKSYIVLFFFKDWGVKYESAFESPLLAFQSICIQHLIPWKEFSKEEQIETERIINSTNALNCIIKNLVWNFECSILGNSLKVYIVKS